MVQEIKETPGFTPVSPSVVQQDQPIDPIETGSLPSSEAPLAQQSDQPPVVKPEELRGAIDPAEKEIAKVDPAEPVHTDSQTPGISSDVPQIEIPELSSILDVLAEPDWDQDIEQVDHPVMNSTHPAAPELQGYTSVLSRLTDPTSADAADGAVTPSSEGFVDPLINPAVRSEVKERYKGKHVPASIRLNNMGAVSIVGKIEGSFGASQPGFVGVVKRPKSEGGYYAKYATPEHGVAAASKLLEKYGRQGVNTPVAITNKWAASPGNYPNVLVNYLNQAGYNVGRDTPLDLSDPGVRTAILKAKSAHESGFGKPVYSEEVFRRGVAGEFS